MIENQAVMIRKTGDARYLCGYCDVERLGCGCDGALDDGCFLCAPERHHRPSCPPLCLGYVTVPKPPVLHPGISMTAAEYEYAAVLDELVRFAYTHGFHEIGVNAIQELLLASRLAGAKHAYAECRAIAASHQNIGKQFGLEHPACGNMIVQQIEVAEHMTENRGHTLEFYR